MSDADLGPQADFLVSDPQVSFELDTPSTEASITALGDVQFTADPPTEAGFELEEPTAEVQVAEYTYRPQPAAPGVFRQALYIVQEEETTFTLPEPFLPESVHLYINGLRQRRTDWTHHTLHLTFLDHPLYGGDEVSVTYTPEFI